ncbi:MAG: DUF3048 domain-containing protein [Anaerolineae bacterium]
MKFVSLCLFLPALLLAACGPGGGRPASIDPTPLALSATESPSPTATRRTPPPATPGPTNTLSPGQAFAPTIAVGAAETSPASGSFAPTIEVEATAPLTATATAGQTPATSTPTGTSTPTPAAIPTATPTAAATPLTVAPVQAVVNSDNVNLRGGPGTNYARLGQVQTGQAVEVVGRNADSSWWQICCPLEDGRESWISAEFLDVDAPPEAAQTAVAQVASPSTRTPTPEPEPAPPSATPSPAGGGGQASAVTAPPANGLPGPGNFPPPGELNPLTGLRLDPELRNQRPVIVCINNDAAARPQHGTSRADVFYEYLMEGYGITRFSGIFYGETAERIGPVRSARLINFYLGALYNAPLLCSGGSDPVRYILKNEAPFPYLDIDLDDPANRRYSVSIGQDYRTRLQTDSERFRRWLADWGVEEPARMRGFTFGGLPAGGLPATAIDIPYPTVTGSQVAYTYQPSSGRYLRFLGDAPHLDGSTGQQLALDNVIVQVVPHEATDIVEDSLGSTSIRLNLFGQGPALVFRDGLAFEGTWRSDSRGDAPHFFDANGVEILLKPGKSWISVVPASYTIGFE